MFTDGSLSCASLCCSFANGASGEDAFHDNLAWGKGDVTNHPGLTLNFSKQTATAIPSQLPSESGIISTDGALGVAVHPDYTKQSADHVVDYWFHQLELSLETTLAETSNLQSLPSVLVLGDTSVVVSSTLFILYNIHVLSEAYVSYNYKG